MEEAFSETRAHFLAALEQGDAEAAAAVYADDARLLPPSAELIEGREAIKAFWQAGLDSGIAAVELEMLEVARGVTLAYEIGRYLLRLDGDNGAPVVDRGKYVLVHERQDDGSWRRAVEMFNPDSPPVSARQAEERRKG